jgi:hypothetical protein
MDYEHLLVTNGDGDAPIMHVETARSVGDTTLDVDTVVNVPATFIGTYGVLGSDGFITALSKRDFWGHESGGNLEIDGFFDGSTDDGNEEGDVVVIKPNTWWANKVAEVILALTGTGTPLDVVFGTLTATDADFTTLGVSGLSTLGGSLTVGGNILITGTSNLVVGTTATVDGGGNITPSAQLYNVTALGAAAAILAPTFTPSDRMSGSLKIKDDGTGRALTWNSAWLAVGVTLPTTTVAGKWLYISYEYSAADSKWHVLGVARQA